MTCVEIFQLSPHSSSEELQRCLLWVQANFSSQQFASISIIVKRTSEHENVSSTLDEPLSSNHDSLSKLQLCSLGHQQSENQDQTTLPHNDQVSLRDNRSNTSDSVQRLEVQMAEEAHALMERKEFSEALEIHFKIKKLTDNLEVQGGEGQGQNRGELILLRLETLVKMGMCSLFLKRGEQAISLLEESAEFHKKILMQGINARAEILYELFSSLGDSYQNQKIYEKSIPNFQAALAVLEKATDFPEASKLKGNLHNFLGLAHYCLGNIPNAVTSFDISLALSIQLNGPNDIQVANRMNNLAEAYRNQGEYRKALDLFMRSLQIKQENEQSVKNTQGIGKTCQNIGITFSDMNEHAQAVKYYEMAIESFKLVYSEHQRDDGGIILSGLYSSLAECHKMQNNFQAAADCCEQVYDIHKEMYGANHRQTIASANSLASLLFKLSKFEQSSLQFKQILKFQRDNLGETSIHVVQTLINLGTIFCKMKDFDQGITKIDQALAILEADPQSDQLTIQKTKQTRLHFQKKQSAQRGSPEQVQNEVRKEDPEE